MYIYIEHSFDTFLAENAYDNITNSNVKIFEYDF